LTSALVGAEWSASRSSRFTSREKAPGTHWIGDWVSPRAGLYTVEKRKFFTLLGLNFDPSDTQTIARCYTDRAILAYLSSLHIFLNSFLKLKKNTSIRRWGGPANI
jgi:hypothetical protein